MRPVSFSIAAFLVANTVASLPNSNPGPLCKAPSVRREWRALKKHGQKAYIDAVKCMARLPHNPSLTPSYLSADQPSVNPNSSRWDDIVYTHMDATDTAHFTGRFLPWHRIFLHTVETILKTECNYTGTIPYWDWTLDSKDVRHSSIWSSDPETGMGAFPEEKDGYNVTTGAFSNFTRFYPTPHIIQRNFTLKPYEQAGILPWDFPFPHKEANSTLTKAEQNKIIRSFTGNFTAFQRYIDGERAEGLHNAVHLLIGGDISDVSHSPNDPFFFLLHGNLDRVWSLWQAADPENVYATGGGEKQGFEDIDAYLTGKAPWVNSSTLLRVANLGGPTFEGKTVGHVANTTGGFLCYVYE